MKNEGFSGETAPTTYVAIAALQEINGTVEFSGPAVIDNLTLRLVQEYQRTGLQDGIHRPILQPDEAVSIFLQVQTVEKIQWHFAPPADELTKKCGVIQIDLGVQRLRYRGTLAGREMDFMGRIQPDVRNVSAKLIARYAIPAENLV